MWIVLVGVLGFLGGSVNYGLTSGGYEGHSLTSGSCGLHELVVVVELTFFKITELFLVHVIFVTFLDFLFAPIVLIPTRPSTIIIRPRGTIIRG